MRKLIVDDLSRFAFFLEVSKSREAVDGIFATVKEETGKRKQEMEALRDKAAGGDRAAKQKLAAMAADDSWQTELGVKAAFCLSECAARAGAMEALYRFLAPVWGMAPADVRNCTLDEFGSLMTAMVKDNDLASFFGAARPAGRSRFARFFTGAMRILRGSFRWNSRRQNRH